MKMSDFQVYVLAPQDRSVELGWRVHATYQMWDRVWSEALRELDGINSIPSDEFTRHREVLVLFFGNEPIASLFFSPVDLGTALGRKDSYFAVWPDETLDRMNKLFTGLDVLICCQFTVAPEWRRESQGVSVKRLLAALAIEHLKASSCRGMTGNTRKNRGIHKIFYDVGGQALAEDVICHGVEVDLMYFDRNHCQAVAHRAPFGREAAQLYSQRVCSASLVSEEGASLAVFKIAA